MSIPTPPPKHVTLTGSLQRETEKAFLFSVSGYAEETLEEPVEVWIPKSQVFTDGSSQTPAGEDIDYLIVTDWIWDKKLEELYDE